MSLMIERFVRYLVIKWLGLLYLFKSKLIIKLRNCKNPNSDVLLSLEGIRSAKVAVILHLYYESCWEEIDYYLSNIEEPVDLYISLGDRVSEITENKLLLKYPNAVIYKLPNVGRDIAPFIHIFKSIDIDKYEAICKIHSKKSKHRVDGALWRNYLLGRLLGSPRKVKLIREKINGFNVGMISPFLHRLCSNNYINNNQELLSKLIETHGEIYGSVSFDFVGGSMFWFKPQALKPLLFLDIGSFELENNQLDGTLAHAIERYLGYVVLKVQKMKIKEM
ncbi:rhamnan synthesis F family protein [Vibrio cyclitrophicus]